MKVLIISHNVISTTNNMGKTLYSLFSEFNKDEICQLYVHPMDPDVDICSSYYCITDEEVVKSLYSFSKPGHILDKNTIIKPKIEKKYIPLEVSELIRKNSSDPIKRLLRDLVWKIAKWNNTNLSSWLNSEKPTCIFLAPGYAKFIYDIALEISDQLDIPIITYICDDYYFVNNPQNIFGKLQVLLLKKKMRKLFKKTSHMIAICDEIKDSYSKEFGIDSTVIMTGASHSINDEIKMKDVPKEISYFGNIWYNRNLSLAEIGEALDEINIEKKTDYKLKIYTDEKKENVLNVFKKIKSIQVCDFVVGEEFEKKFSTSDFLLHVESFDKKYIDIVKNSISTKIADSLGSGIPLIAYGPESIASISYLKNNETAFVISQPSNIKQKLEVMFEDTKALEYYVKNALEIAKMNHVSKKNSKLVKQICGKYDKDALVISEVREYEKKLLLHLKEICDENKIEFFLSNGTLLGAVKYKGFIPWDDDIDVLIPRNDYEKLLKIYQNSTQYALFSKERNNNYRYPFAKLCDMTTRKVETNVDNGVDLGIDIDIFPLDKWSDNENEAKKQVRKILNRIRLLNFSKLQSNRGKTKIRTLVKTVAICFSKMIGINNLIYQIQAIAKNNSLLNTSKYCGCVVWPIYGEKEIIEKEVFEDTIEVEFEGEIYPAPIGYDVYLRSLYGDYVLDPPIEKQKTHHRFTAYKL